MQRKSCQTKNFYLRETDEKFSTLVFYLRSSAQQSEDTALPPSNSACCPWLGSTPRRSSGIFISHIIWGFPNTLASGKSSPIHMILSSHLPKDPSYVFPSVVSTTGRNGNLLPFKLHLLISHGLQMSCSHWPFRNIISLRLLPFKCIW